ncbi:MAG TPA: hypothetical protein VG994_12880 [Steroidobacteraceae bacterium]|nr:hypothetical protein [Steroidobacteraceae bacterium]
MSRITTPITLHAAFERTAALELEPAIAATHWEAKWFRAGSALDPAYDRATAALRRWVDGMEAALQKRTC